MKKKIISLCMALAMICCIMPVSASAINPDTIAEKGIRLTFSDAVSFEDTEISHLYRNKNNLLEKGATDNMIRFEEINFLGNSIENLDIWTMKKLMTQNGFEYSEQNDGDHWWIGTTAIGKKYGATISALQNKQDDYVALWGYSHYGSRIDDLPLPIGVRDINSCDTLDKVLSQLGFSNSTEISDYIKKIVTTPYNSMEEITQLLNELEYDDPKPEGPTFRFTGNGSYRPLDNGTYVHEEVEFEVVFGRRDKKSYSLTFRFGDTTSLQYSDRLYEYAVNVWGHDQPSSEYIYDTPDPGAEVKLPAEALEKVKDASSAVDAVRQLTSGMTSEQKTAPTGIDLATLYAETAVAKAASKAANSNEIIISAATVADMETSAAQAAKAVESALTNGGITTARYLANTVTLTTGETGKIAIKIDPDILTTDVDKIRVETPSYALTLRVADLAEDLKESITIAAEDVGSGFAPGGANSKTTVKIDLPKAQMTNPVIISLPRDSSDTTYQAVVKTDGTATASKFNPATVTMDGRINASGTYTVKTNEKSFTDISNKSAEMQKAILYLTSKGIINGTSATTFSPDNSISRQQIAALLMRALGKVDNTATTTFKDVSRSSSLYHAIASSQKHGVINGYTDNTFRGTNVISRAQIVTVSGRVLTSEMNYKAPANMSAYLAKYSDTVPDYAQAMVALATREGLIVYRTDGTFSGGKNMTRGDAAIILYRLFQKIW